MMHIKNEKQWKSEEILKIWKWEIWKIYTQNEKYEQYETYDKYEKSKINPGKSREIDISRIRTYYFEGNYYK